MCRAAESSVARSCPKGRMETDSRKPSTPRAIQCSAPRAASCASASCAALELSSSSARLTLKLRKPSSARGKSPTTVSTAKILERKRIVIVSSAKREEVPERDSYAPDVAGQIAARRGVRQLELRDHPSGAGAHRGAQCNGAVRSPLRR